ncbi:hypothetical protein AGLY_014631 [Aphis glycines]|uniref:Uncharacterized protein n=1 Tax=Aphis glycines TaxID=307491 RepID=A0A6G0T3T5_APHGL|nr:hypothetical protein AGLY_014631 [Aphis glycines]
MEYRSYSSRSSQLKQLLCPKIISHIIHTYYLFYKEYCEDNTLFIICVHIDVCGLKLLRENIMRNIPISFITNALKYKKFIKKIQSIRNNILHLVCHGLKTISHVKFLLNKLNTRDKKLRHRIVGLLVIVRSYSEYFYFNDMFRMHNTIGPVIKYKSESFICVLDAIHRNVWYFFSAAFP